MNRIVAYLLWASALWLCTPSAASASKTTRITGHRIEISGEVLFETGSARLKQKSYSILGDIAKFLKNNPKISRVKIAGHTDDVGEAEANLNLSKQRAEAVRQHLVSLGIDEKRLSAKGYGESKPLVQATTPDARAKNRRVDFIILKPISVSVNAGLVGSMVSGDDDLKGTSGFLIGSTLHYGVASAIELNLGLYYGSRGAKDIDSELALSYIEVPITALYLFPNKGKPLQFNAGAGFSMALNQGATWNDDDVDAESPLISAILTGGGTYDLSTAGMLRLQLRYNHATGDVLSDVDDFTVHTVDMQVGYIF